MGGAASVTRPVLCFAAIAASVSWAGGSWDRNFYGDCAGGRGAALRAKPPPPPSCVLADVGRLVPQPVEEAGDEATAVATTTRWLASTPVRRSSVGFGALGLSGHLGFEGRCVAVRVGGAGVAAMVAEVAPTGSGNRPAFEKLLSAVPVFGGRGAAAASVAADTGLHSVAMHPPAFGTAFAEFDLSLLSGGEGGGGSRGPAQPPRLPTRRVLATRVGVNDGNNMLGRAGSPLVFAVVDGSSGAELWRCVVEGGWRRAPAL